MKSCICIAEAEAMLQPLEHVARALASELLVKRTMTGAEVVATIAAAVAAHSIEVERERRADWHRRQESAREFAERWICRDDAPSS
jgi:hypothetical protein